MILEWLPFQDPRRIWEQYREALSEDFLYDPQTRQRTASPLVQMLGKSTALRLLRDVCIERNLNPDDFLPVPELLSTIKATSKHLLRETTYDREALQREYERLFSMISTNPCQLDAWTAVQNALSGAQENVIYLDGPAGTGKTTLYNALLSQQRALGNIALANAFSGIAAQQLPGGKTVHSRWRLPVPLPLTDASCGVDLDSDAAEVMRLAALIVWDEGPNAPLAAFEAVDRFFRDLMSSVDPSASNKPFGGKVMVIGGDFRQIPPVIRRVDPLAVRQYMLPAASFFTSPSTRHFPLKRNMRAKGDAKYADFLLEVGNGTYSDAPVDTDLHPAAVRLPDAICDTNLTSDTLASWVYDNVPTSHQFDRLEDYYRGRCILATTNADADSLNARMLETLHGNIQKHVYLSQDSVLDATDAEKDQFPEDFLNGITSGGMPPHELILCQGALVMCLRNMAPDLGLCNGTRGIVIDIRKNLIELQLLLPDSNIKGRRVWVPRILCDTSADGDLPFTLRRRQFPLRLSWAMTINKSQGTNLTDKLGILLERPVFAHGQLYVALSRAGAFDRIRVVVKEVAGMQGHRDGSDGPPQGITRLISSIEGFFNVRVSKPLRMHPQRLTTPST